MLALDGWIGRSGPRSNRLRRDDWHFRGRPDPRHASRRGRTVGNELPLLGPDHAAAVLQRKGVFVFDIA